MPFKLFSPPTVTVSTSSSVSHLHHSLSFHAVSCLISVRDCCHWHLLCSAVCWKSCCCSPCPLHSKYAWWREVPKQSHASKDYGKLKITTFSWLYWFWLNWTFCTFECLFQRKQDINFPRNLSRKCDGYFSVFLRLLHRIINHLTETKQIHSQSLFLRLLPYQNRPIMNIFFLWFLML